MGAVPLFAAKVLPVATIPAGDPLVGSSAPLPLVDFEPDGARKGRRLTIYQPGDAFDLVDELVYLANRSIEKNIFFDPRFLVPAMPRLDERAVRLLVMRDEAPGRSRLRLLMPFSIEKAGLFGRHSTIRAWSHPFGPLGTLPLDGDDPVGTVTDFLAGLANPALGWPSILVLPDVRTKGAMAAVMEEAARCLGLSIVTTNRTSRAALEKRGLPALRQRPDAKRRRDLERCRRRLEAQGTVSVSIAREPEAFRLALEDFFILEASGWKGQARSALISDRFRAAFAREALNALAAKDKARIFSLRLDNEAIASLVVLVDDGEAYAWKSAYDERFAKVSPGHLIMAEATRVLIADPTVQRADSCAVPDHFVMNRFWHDRIEIGTLVVGLHPGMQDAVERAAKGLENRKRTQNRVRILRQRLQAAFGG